MRTIKIDGHGKEDCELEVLEISDLVTALQQIKDEHGDLLVFNPLPTTSSPFHVEPGNPDEGSRCVIEVWV